PSASAARCSAAVPFAQLSAWGAPMAEAKAASNAVTAGPVVSQSPRSTSTTAAMSSASIVCRPYGSIGAVSAILELAQHLLEARRIEPVGVRIADVAEAVGHLGIAFGGAAAVAPPRKGWQDDVAIGKLDRRARVVLVDQHLVELLAGADAHDIEL